MPELNDNLLTGILCFLAGVGAREVVYHVQLWFKERTRHGGPVNGTAGG
jgi:hypothetical protein